ncbi:MAG: haloacid dehalogenase-like hydrolase [Leptospiraceae bacterium]|nr:haloacid dehalogenase-like hydrolase [Leptospiraceae bacterium]
MNRFMTNNAIFSCVCLLAFLLSTGGCAEEEPAEPHAREVLKSILETRDSLASQCGDGCIFLTFWDFDGTILKGDCSEGLREDGNLVYRGLVELTIEAGFSSKFRRNEAALFEEEYRQRDESRGHRDAYTFLTTQYGGAHPDEITAFATKRFQEVYQNYYFRSSLEVWNGLSEAGIQNHIISASPHFFVLGAGPTLSAPPERINGVRLKMRNGALLPVLDPPLTYAEGKTSKLKEIVDRIRKENPKKKVYVLAAFGNSYHTDGDFLKYVQELSLPAGKTSAIMINGGAAPEEYSEFWTVDQRLTARDTTE